MHLWMGQWPENTGLLGGRESMDSYMGFQHALPLQHLKITLKDHLDARNAIVLARTSKFKLALLAAPFILQCRA